MHLPCRRSGLYLCKKTLAFYTLRLEALRQIKGVGGSIKRFFFVPFCGTQLQTPDEIKLAAM
jgi:hypothetical protein